MQIEDIIIKQLAGSWGRLSAMTGARGFVGSHGDHGGLSFKYGRGKYCLIKLRADDTYDVEFCRIVMWEKRDVVTHEGIYADQLANLFESHTGLYLSL